MNHQCVRSCGLLKPLTHTDPSNVEQIQSLYHIYLYFYYGHTHYGCFFCCFLILFPLIFQSHFPLNVNFFLMLLCQIPFSQDSEYSLLLVPTTAIFLSIPPICECGALTTDQMKCPVSLLRKPPPRVLLCGDLPRPQSPSWLPQMIHLKCLAVRTPDSRHVNMNHATPHTAAAVLFAGLLLLAQRDAQLPVTCGGSGGWGQKHTQVFWSSARRSGPAVWRANFIEMDWVKVFFFFLSVFFSKAQFKWVLLQRKKKKF